MPKQIDTNDLLDEIFHGTVRVDKIYAIANTVHHDSLDDDWTNLLEDGDEDMIKILKETFGIEQTLIDRCLDSKSGASILAQAVMTAALKKNLNGFILGYERAVAQEANGTHYGFGHTQTHYFYTKEINARTLKKMVVLARRHFDRECRELKAKKKAPAIA